MDTGIHMGIKGLRYTEIQGYRDKQEYRDTGIQGCRDTGIKRYRDKEIQGYRDSDIVGYMNTQGYTGIYGYRNTGIQ